MCTHGKRELLCSVLFSAANEPQPVDAALFHLLSADRGLLRAQHVRGGGGGKLPQVPAPPGGRGGQAQGGEETETHGEKETE